MTGAPYTLLNSRPETTRRVPTCMRHDGAAPASGPASMKNTRHRQGEGRNGRVELLSVFGHHLVRAAHGPDCRLQMRATAVFEALAGLEQRLLSDHAEALDLDDLVVGVGDDPMTADQLRGNRAGIGDRDRVRKDILVLRRVRLVLDVACLGDDGDLVFLALGHDKALPGMTEQL